LYLLVNIDKNIIFIYTERNIVKKKE
jgi:hypothetical protein